MVNRFSTLRDTQRGSQSYMKKRRGRREIDEREEQKGDLRGYELATLKGIAIVFIVALFE